MSDELPLMKKFLGSYRHPDARLFRRQIIDKTVRELRSERVHQLKAGIKGQADVYGFVRVNMTKFAPIPIEIEFKGLKTKVEPEQEMWRQFCENWNIPHLILRAAHDETDEQTLTRWAFELDKFINKL